MAVFPLGMTGLEGSVRGFCGLLLAGRVVVGVDMYCSMYYVECAMWQRGLCIWQQQVCSFVTVDGVGGCSPVCAWGPVWRFVGLDVDGVVGCSLMCRAWGPVWRACQGGGVMQPCCWRVCQVVRQLCS